MVKKLRSGSAMVFVLIIGAMITILVGSMATYFVTTARLSNNYVNRRSVPRQEAMRALEKVTQMAQGMVASANASASARKGVTVDEIANDVNTAIVALNANLDNYLGGNYHVVLSVERLTDADHVKLKVTAKVYEKGVSLTPENVLVVLEMIMEFWGAPPSVLSLPEIFQYVYFVDNYGHLESESIIVNGNAHANNKFTVKYGVVNGVVSAASNTVSMTNARAWPASTYAKKIKVANGNATMAQVRPTNPITRSDGTSQAWDDGYEPVVMANPYAGEYETVGGKRPTAADRGISETPPAFDGGNPPVLSNYLPSSLSRDSVKSIQVQETGAFGRVKTVTYYYYEYTYAGTTYHTEWRTLPSTCKTVDWYSFKSQYDGHVSNANSAYNSALQAFNNKVTYYNNVTLKPWNDLAADQATWDQKAAEWIQKRKVWANDYDTNGTLETDLASAKTRSSTLFYRNNAAIIEMLNVSDVSAYKAICTGKLICSNSYNNASGVRKRIAWKHRNQVDRALMVVYKYDLLSGKYDYKGLEDSNIAKLIQATRLNGSNPWSQISPNPMTRELSVVSFSGCVSNFYPFSNYSNPCKYNGSFTFLKHPIPLEYTTRTAEVKYPAVTNTVKKLEKDSVILIGTKEYPIILNGPVYVPGDVVIRGMVTGRGTIYSGRNIHIIGDLLYTNPPKWPYDKTGFSTSKTKVDSDNRQCDILLLSARGNIVIGDYTATTWSDSANAQYLKSLHGESSGYGDVYDDKAIGYTDDFKKNRDYTALDGGKKPYFVAADENKALPYATAPWYYLEYVQKDEIWYYAPKLSAPSSKNRRFYDCALGDEVIAGLKQLDSGEAEYSWQKPFGNTAASENGNSGDITQIDAILFANHGILGVVGGSNSHKFVLNGAMACRDEALFPSFDARFRGQSPAPQIWLNWDMRFITDELTDWVAISTGGGCVSNKVSSWRQVK